MVMDWGKPKFAAGARSVLGLQRSPSRKREELADQRPASTSSPKGLVAPHPIPKGKENAPCPITGMFLSAPLEGLAAAREAKRALDDDPDIADERATLQIAATGAELVAKPAMVASASIKSFQFIPMDVRHGAHRPSGATRKLIEQIGGVPTLRLFTTKFYELSFADSHIDQFIADHNEPHGERFANWIAEKFGAGTPWTEERRTRPMKYMRLGHEVVEVSHDRSTSHLAAWFSPKREPEKRGEHFKPDDARVWMRLHFWAARETGLFDEHPQFMDYYMRFIGHFVSVYSGKSPPFTRESARWSADPANIQRYLTAGRRMSDVIGKDVEVELQKLPREERAYTGSRHPQPSWPYGQTR
mmetsp:Transcript_53060/g.124318  ORF Transcript_53060/g.124318 Transcript_53060/m.124318 type:complete len:358 (+) Transcript_53060:59-1132(+)